MADHGRLDDAEEKTGDSVHDLDVHQRADDEDGSVGDDVTRDTATEDNLRD